MNQCRFEKANIVTAFDGVTVGTKVIQPITFLGYLDEAICKHDPSKDRAKGQHYIVLPPEARATVSAGEGRRTKNPDDYVIRVHRGEPSLFLRRDFAGEVENLACIVYTRNAYLLDPDVLSDKYEHGRISNQSVTHVLVAVIASTGISSPLTPDRLVKNLAGGNKEALMWSADEIRQKASKTNEYWSNWCVVAD